MIPAAALDWPPLEQLLQKTRPNAHGCLVWRGATNNQGYGHLTRRGGDGQSRSAQVHRLVFQHSYGQIPDGYLVLHRCDNPACCQPVHLMLGTHKTNSADMIAKGRDWQPTQRGGGHPRARLTEDVVREIRQALAAGTATQKVLAQRFGVSESCIQHVHRRRVWSHVA